LQYLLLILIALTVVVSLQTVGLALMVAMLVTPAATAYLLTRRLWHMMIIGAIIGAVSSVAGLYLSFYINIASGAAVVLVCTAFFVVAFLFAPGRGTVWTWLRERRGSSVTNAQGIG
jgi:ABC-type Mn2+/Zn2+ transport system permease subunit